MAVPLSSRQTYLPQLVPQRIAAMRERVAQAVWGPARSIAVAGSEVLPSPVPLARGRRLRLRAVESGERFGPAECALRAGDYRQRWFRLRIPAAPAGERGRRHLHWLCGGESTVYLDGEPWWGLDVAHSTCPLPDRALELWRDCGCYQTGMNGLFGAAAQRLVPAIPNHDDRGLEFIAAHVRLRDPAAWEAFWDLDALGQLLVHGIGRHLPGEDTTRHAQPALPVLLRGLLRKLDDAADAYDGGGIAALTPHLKRALKTRRAEPWQCRLSLCGHSHLDVLHLWPEIEAVRKSVHTGATTLRLMERYPELRFMQSQSHVYARQQALSPKFAARIARQIAKGGWEATGGMVVESDMQIPCGEALARSLMLGQRDFARLRGGRRCRTLWLPDVFGLPACLPQLMRLAGLDSLFTVKNRWSLLTNFPHRSWVWRSPDGGEVVAHSPGTGNYCQQVDLGDLVKLAEDHQQADVHPEMLIPTGYGDGGGGVTEAMCERARRFADLAGAPRTRWSTVEAFFRRLHAASARLPAYQGELYLERHQGVTTGENAFKSAYRRAERGLQVHEAACALAGVAAPVDEDWREVCLDQFHDAITGTSIQRVFHEHGPRLDAISARGHEAAIRHLGDARGEPCCFNPSPLARTVLVVVPADAATALPGSAQQPASAGSILLSLACPPCSVTPITAAAAPGQACVAGDGRVGNGRVEARFSTDGSLKSLRIDGEDLAIEGSSFLLHPNRPMGHDAWDIDAWNLRKAETAVLDGPLRVHERGPLRASLVGVWRVGDSRLEVVYEVEAGQPWLRVCILADWRERHRLLKHSFATGYRGREALFGAPFGMVARPQMPGQLADEAQWEVCGNRWAAVVDDAPEHGLAIIAEDRWGFSCRDGTLGLSLLRSAMDPHAGADVGEHLIRYAIGCHRRVSAAGSLSTAAAADALFLEAPVLMRAKPQPALATWGELGSLLPSWITPTASGLMLRAHETDGRRGEALLDIGLPHRRLRMVDFLGRKRTDRCERLGDGTYRISYGPHQILSIAVD
jgi:alpha-mannosidase